MAADGRAGHLADGGYFDNSGAQTVADTLAALRAFVARQQATTLRIRLANLGCSQPATHCDRDPERRQR